MSHNYSQRTSVTHMKHELLLTRLTNTSMICHVVFLHITCQNKYPERVVYMKSPIFIPAASDNAKQMQSLFAGTNLDIPHSSSICS